MQITKTGLGALALSAAMLIGTALPSSAQNDNNRDRPGGYSRSDGNNDGNNGGNNDMRRGGNHGGNNGPQARSPDFRAPQGNATANRNVTSNNRSGFDPSRFERRGDSGFYNNHQGYRDRRPGYRYYNGFWFPPAAFIAGAIIGSVANPYYGNDYYAQSGDAHTQWCAQTYRSYEVASDTFQPYNGPRQLCVSPYDG